ncbi:MAG: DUF2238 domain-containing protein [Verrucomicrobiales bacterium]|nr:DUF2238 domain-containing protein [Verrucomicrobiales bacterium]
MSAPNREPLFLLAITGIALAWSAINPHDYLTWLLETAPVFIGVAIIIPTRNAFPLSPLLFRLLVVHAIILIIGAHYTYALVPPGFWFQDLFDLSRNHYDRLGHLAQGFVPAILVRELLIRRSPLPRGKWMFTLTTSVCLAFSAFYEMIEWWTALLGGHASESFLGTQGDIWDTQWDMFLALIGAVAAQLMLAKTHDRSITKVTGQTS